MEFTFFVAKVSHWARNCPCLRCSHYAVQIGQGRTVLQNLLLHRNVCQICYTWGLKIGVPTLQRNLG
ncbi:hypothetical protein I79_016270 [Cricetulus griseus]|uniref:Uncharacterized protein n=1 Tax=Cricetulus griseus TaxID=10029 RepID=G3HYX7_CRIGR|nr:hypothetical protein I79_016270 [Cricetulus griseus]